MTSLRNKSPLVAAALLVLLASHSSGQEHPRKIKYQTVTKHFTCSHSARDFYAITDDEAWKRLWASLMYEGGPPAPEVDFSRNSLIAVFQGDQRSSGFDIAVSKIVKKDGHVTVHVKEVIPEDACKVLMVVTQPFHIVLTKKLDDPSVVDFKVKQRIKVCE
jgi:hypothetical protein